jgi:opacity protein-like surface antigen
VAVTRRNVLSTITIAVVVFGSLLVTPADARAQGFISPFVGFDFGGDSGCQTASNCEDKNSNVGVAFGRMGDVVGFETEIGYARDFFGDTPGVSSNVLTLMANFMVVPKIGPVRPYVLGGLGLIKTRVELTAPSLLETTNNSLGWDFGGGVMILFGEHIGVRGDLRRFSTFQERSLLGIANLTNERISFQRASAGLVLAF